jgi:hypothetical protein
MPPDRPQSELMAIRTALLSSILNFLHGIVAAAQARRAVHDLTDAGFDKLDDVRMSSSR